MEIPKKYVLPCKTNGMCRSIELSESFPDNPNFPHGRVEIGINFIEFEPGDFNSRVTFRCCTGCKLPFNSAEAVRLNEEIGLELESTESLLARMAKLRAKVNGPK